MHDHDDDLRARLAAWRAPPGDANAKAALITRLTAESAALPLHAIERGRGGEEKKENGRLGYGGASAAGSFGAALTWSAWILRAQARIIPKTAWVAAALIIALGVAVSLAIADNDAEGARRFIALPLVIFAPLAAALSVALAYGDMEPPIEIQWATPASPRIVLLARLALIVSVDLCLALIASVILVAAGVPLTFGALITAWLAPMAVLSLLAFAFSVWLLDALMSGALSLIVWVALTARQFSGMVGLPIADWLPDGIAIISQPGMMAAALGLAALAAWHAGNTERA